MKSLFTLFCIAVISLVAIQLIWHPISSVSVETTTSSKTSSTKKICEIEGKRCGNVVMWYHRHDERGIGIKTWTYVYGGKKANWVKVKGLGGIRRNGKFVSAMLTKPLLVKSAQNGTPQVKGLHEELIYGHFGKKGQFRKIKNSLWVGGRGAPIKRKLKTVKGGKKHVVVLTSASLSLISPAFQLPEYPLHGG